MTQPNKALQIGGSGINARPLQFFFLLYCVISTVAVIGRTESWLKPHIHSSHYGLLCHREEVLSVVRIGFSESVVFWVFSFSVFCLVVFLFGVCFVSLLLDTWPFAFHLFSNTRRCPTLPSLLPTSSVLCETAPQHGCKV